MVIPIGIIEDDTLIRENLTLFFEDQKDIEVVLLQETVEDALADANLTKVDILLLDIGLPGMSGLEGLRPIKQKSPNTDVIMLTSFEDSDRIFKALCAGASAYISKRTPLDKIKEAILVVKNGGAYMSPAIAKKVIQHFAPKPIKKDDKLTPRQKQIVDGLMEGLSYKMIADKLLISLETVRDHIKKIYKKLEVNSRTEVIRKRLNREF